MAVHWLDLVRYSDTIGYHSDVFMEVSAYRDYVIDAFNQNMSYDQFVIENLAGDLLPEAGMQQKIASGYNRLLQTTEEGGAQAAEYQAIYQADRVRNFGLVWLGATTGCAQCHDHKYDPFTIKDFYSLAAFFADIQEKPVGRRNPNLYLPTPEQEKKLEELQLAKKETDEIHCKQNLLKNRPIIITMNLQIVELKRRKEYLSKTPPQQMPNFTANGNLRMTRSFQVQNHLFEQV
jgi:hypothetical protein